MLKLIFKTVTVLLLVSCNPKTQDVDLTTHISEVDWESSRKVAENQKLSGQYNLTLNAIDYAGILNEIPVPVMVPRQTENIGKEDIITLEDGYSFLQKYEGYQISIDASHYSLEKSDENFEDKKLLKEIEPLASYLEDTYSWDISTRRFGADYYIQVFCLGEVQCLSESQVLMLAEDMIVIGGKGI